MSINICAITGSRAEFGVMAPSLRAINKARRLRLQLVVIGMHLSKEFGYTLNEIIENGFQPADTVEMMLSSDTMVGMGKSIGLGVISMVDSLSRIQPDIVVVAGDRFEIFAASVAAMSLGIPIAHISGGEITEGAIDEQMRHAITKMSHIHFVALDKNRDRVLQMGEEPWRIHVVGGPWVETIRRVSVMSKKNIADQLKVDLGKPTILVTYHPVTLEVDDTKRQIDSLLTALEMIDLQIIFTYPNSDAGGRVIIEAIKKFVYRHRRAKAFQSLGSVMYLNLLSNIKMVVGNSSSGMLESQEFNLPVVNIGTRQKGRIVTENIICVAPESEAIYSGICKGLGDDFKEKLKSMKNPYDQGGFSENIIKVLESLPDKATLLRKKFYIHDLHELK
jgi:GDP/UDP-N,N'-diacetylbacillosamine 2-epimerase (hydrolysing)